MPDRKHPGRVAWAQATPHMCLVLGAPIPCYPPRVALVKRNATYDDLCALPDNMVAEIIDGDLFASPRPASPHALASSMLGAALISSFGGERRALRGARPRHTPLVARAVARDGHPLRRGPGPRRWAAGISSAARLSISARIVSAPRIPTR